MDTIVTSQESVEKETVYEGAMESRDEENAKLQKLLEKASWHRGGASCCSSCRREVKKQFQECFEKFQTVYQPWCPLLQSLLCSLSYLVPMFECTFVYRICSWCNMNLLKETSEVDGGLLCSSLLFALINLILALRIADGASCWLKDFILVMSFSWLAGLG